MFLKPDPELPRKISVMRGYFTSLQFQATLQKRLKEKATDFFTKR